MTNLANLICTAENIKPSMGDPCNHCGWCCMTEVCIIGKKLLKSESIPCELLIKVDGRYYCSIASIDSNKKQLGIGTGCCAQTQKEMIALFSS